MITFTIPAPSSMLMANLLGLFAMIGLAVAVGGLTSNLWWALGVVSVEAMFLSIVAATNIQRAAAKPDETPAAARALSRTA